MKKILLFVLVVIILGVGITIYLYFKPHRNVSSEDAKFELKASQLFDEFQKDENAANKKYLGNVVKINGSVSEIIIDNKGNKVVLFKGPDDFFGVSCTFNKNNNLTEISPGKEIAVKGICTGGGTMMDVVLVNCELSND